MQGVLMNFSKTVVMPDLVAYGAFGTSFKLAGFVFQHSAMSY